MLVVIEPVLGLEVTLDLVVDDLGRNGNLEGLDEVFEDLVACLHALVGLLLLGGLLAQVLTQFGDRIELTGQLGEVVVSLGQFALLDRRQGDLHGSLLTGVLATGEGGLEGRGLTGGEAVEGLVHAFEHRSGADLVGDVGGRVDLLVVDGGDEVEGDEVVLGGGTIDRDQGSEAGAQLLELGIHIGIGDLDGVDLDGDRIVGGQLDLGTDVDLHGEAQVAVFGAVESGHLGDLDLGLAHRLEFVLFHGIAVEVIETVVDGFLDHCGTTDPLIDDARGNLALAETGDGDLGTDGLVCLVDARFEFGVWDFHADLDPRGVELLDGALHSATFQFRQSCSCGHLPTSPAQVHGRKGHLTA